MSAFSYILLKEDDMPQSRFTFTYSSLKFISISILTNSTTNFFAECINDAANSGGNMENADFKSSSHCWQNRSYFATSSPCSPTQGVVP